MPISDKHFLDMYSPENFIRQATQSPAIQAMPAEYAQARPDTLAMDTDRLLANMARPTESMQGQPGVPYTNVNYDGIAPTNMVPFRPGISRTNTPLPNIGVDTLTELMRKNESSGNYQALNKQKKGNTASGAYQYTDATWNGFGGYSKAMLAPKEVQDRKFRQDMQARYMKFGGDPFRVIAAHYLPIYANNPQAWNQRYYVDRQGRKHPIELSVAEYIDRTLRVTNLQAEFKAYLQAHGGQI
jgi:hypothetical protein